MTTLDIDESDPCEAAKKLRQLYFGMIAGRSAAEVRFRAGPNGVERQVTFAKGDPDKLLAVIRGFEDQCARLQGKRSRRFALASGGRW